MKTRHMRFRAMMLAVCVGALSTAACKKDTAEADKAAAQAAKEANEASEKANAAKQKANEEAAKANLARSEARTKLQKDLDAHERKATYLKEKAAKATGAAKQNAAAAVTELDTRSAAAKASIAKLADDSATGWESLKKTAEDDVASVGKAVDSLEKTLEKK
jgi:hypothetical protein